MAENLLTQSAAHIVQEDGGKIGSEPTYFAQVQGGVVLRVVVADQSFIDSGALGTASEFVGTYVNGALRGQYAGIGGTYNSGTDLFG